MLDFFEARARVLASAVTLESERVDLSQASGRVLAEDLVAWAPLPAFDYSAMDGYAVRSEDFRGPSPWQLPVGGQCRAGEPPRELPRGGCLRIFTGAALPSGADSVVMQENATALEGAVRFEALPIAGSNVRYAGEDLAQGDCALPRGTRLGPFHLGLAASLDRATLSVSRRPRVTIACSGDELREPGSPAQPGSIPESNGVALAALAALAGAEVVLGPRLPDDAGRAERALRALFEGTDVLVTVGGVSVGDHDVVRGALIAAGAELDFWKVALKPGKPFTFGRHGRTRILGLPGNPASALLTFALFGMPLLRSLQGDAQALPRVLRVRLAQGLRQNPGRLGVYRARLHGELAQLSVNQASGATTSLAHADALVFVPADVSECASGCELDAVRLSEL